MLPSILQDADGLNLAIDSMQSYLKGMDLDVIVGLGIQRIYVWSFPLPIIFTRLSCLCVRKGNFPVRRSLRHMIWKYGKRGDRDP